MPTAKRGNAWNFGRTSLLRLWRQHLTASITITLLPERPLLLVAATDPDVCGWTYGYLYKALLALASAYMRGPAKRLRATRSKAMARNSYLAGAVYIIGMRLEAQKKDTPITPGALVPIKEAVISRSMPELTPRQAPPQKIRDNDFVNGMDAGSAVPLSKPISASAPCRQRLHG